MRPSRRPVATSPPASYKYHCFISYTTREDEIRIIKPFIDDYTRRLHAEGYLTTIFYDGYKIPEVPNRPDDLLAKILADAIYDAAFVVAFVSPGYTGSEWCRFELDTALREHRQRGAPATCASCLPILWKHRYLSNPETLLRHPFLSERQPLDIAHAIAQGRFSRQWKEALYDAREATRRTVHSWYPRL